MSNIHRKQFPDLLYTLLELADVPGIGCSNAVTWLPHGYAFKILDNEQFMRFAAPMFFKQTKIRSFHRQLNLWGFKKVSTGVDAGSWYNEFFLRGSPEKMKKMRRVKIKGPSKTFRAADPDFCSLPPLPVSTKPLTEAQAGKRIGPKTTESSSQVPILCPQISTTMHQQPDCLRAEVSSGSNQKRQVQTTVDCFNSTAILCQEVNLPMMATTLSRNISISSQPPSFASEVDVQRPYTDHIQSAIFPARFLDGASGLKKKLGSEPDTSSIHNMYENRFSGDLEPLHLDEVSLDEEIPADDFAKYIGNAIQVL